MLVDLPRLLGLVGVTAARRKLVHNGMHIVADRDNGAAESSAPTADNYDCAFDMHLPGCARCRECNYCPESLQYTLAAIELRSGRAGAAAKAIGQHKNETQKAKQCGQGIPAGHGHP